MDHLVLSQIFRTIQGEGPSLGTPSVFVRLALCHLRCSWCDTKYTWDWEAYDRSEQTERVQVAEVVRRVQAEGPGRIVLTGGEPLLQAKALPPLLDALADRDWEVETSGSLVPTPELVAAVTQWNVSPKLPSAGNPVERAVVPEALAAFAAMDHAWFKFVIGEADDAVEALAMADAHGIRRERVLFMPQAATAQAHAKAAPRVVALALEHGVRFTPRLHVQLWGGRRGV